MKISLEQQQEMQQIIEKCPRCDSTNTKFCYYNNYSLSQPRHFCKTCKRYWTKGGALRNVPVGGVCRKNRKISSRTMRSSSMSSSSSSSSTLSNHNNNPLFYGLPIINNFQALLPRSMINSSSSRVSSLEKSCFLGSDDHHELFVSSSSSSLPSNPFVSNNYYSVSTLASLMASGGLIKDFVKHEGCVRNFPGSTPCEETLRGDESLTNESGLNDVASFSQHSLQEKEMTTTMMNSVNNYSMLSSSTSVDPSLLFPWNGTCWMDPSLVVPSLL